MELWIPSSSKHLKPHTSTAALFNNLIQFLTCLYRTAINVRGFKPYEDNINQKQVSDDQEPYEDSGSQEPNEESDMSSAEGSENNDLGSHSDQISEVVSSEDERESEAENECPWSPIQDEAIARLDEELKELITKYQEMEYPRSVAEAKGHNILLSNYRKELRKVQIEKLEWMHGMKKNPR